MSTTFTDTVIPALKRTSQPRSIIPADLVEVARSQAAPRVLGRVSEIKGLRLVVRGIEAAVGELVEVTQGGAVVPVEVVASVDGGLVCLPLGDVSGLRVGSLARATGSPLRIPLGPELIGRVIDGLGRPIDGGPALSGMTRRSVEHPSPDPLSRARIERQVGLGVRAMDGLIPLGRGQRIAIMAGSGVGKSTLLSMIARGTDADISVIALVGERGREVREFIENDLGPEGLARSIVVVSTSDAPPVERLRAAFTATRVAEHFRDAGRDVVLMMDSLTRVAMAQREIGLSAGEPPATRGYPPSVFSLMPRLLERAGTASVGSITGLYTVLVEGDDLQDPIGDTVRSIVDGHVVLSRELATAGHFPSIDVLESISRLTTAITTADQNASASSMRRMLAAFRNVKELVEIGAYAAGSDPDADAAMRLRAEIDGFLRQGLHEHDTLETTWQRLASITATTSAAAPEVPQTRIDPAAALAPTAPQTGLVGTLPFARREATGA